MGEKQTALTRVLARVGTTSPRSLEYPRQHDLERFEAAQEVERVYRALGGIERDVRIGFRGWDIEFEGIAVELDEQLHFNRYRAVTLASPLYSELPAFPKAEYARFCVEREGDCLRAGSYGGKWTNPSCEKQFGAAGTKGTLDGTGAPRWKQRAFYDFVKDLSPLLVGTLVVRIAIWDRVPGAGPRTVGEVLDGDGMAYAECLAELVRSRLPSGVLRPGQ